MTHDWTGLTLSLVLPALPLTMAVVLLRRAIGPKRATHWFSLSASAFVFALCTIWMGNSLTYAHLAFAGGTTTQTAQLTNWYALNLQSGIPFSICLLLLVGVFWGWLVYLHRLSGARS